MSDNQNGAGAKRAVPEAVARRIPRYYRHLGELLEQGRARISSKELSKKMGVTASQIRQDLNHFGGFGQQGYGYNVEYLYEEIRKILGITRKYSMIVVGAGNLGQALTNYANFEKSGFYVEALFDVNPKLIGLSIRGIEIKDFDAIGEYLRENETDIAVLCVPGASACKIAETLIQNGVRNIWNFSPADITAPDSVIIENAHLTDSLISLVYKLNEASME